MTSRRPPPTPDLFGIVLAGGRSRRMGADKALLEIHGTPMIRRVLDALREVCAEAVVVAKDPAPYEHFGVRVVVDDRPEQAALVGVCAGLRMASRAYAFVAGCDLPFLSPAAVALLGSFARGWDAAVPHVGGRWHPLHAVYRAEAWRSLDALLAAGERRMTAALRTLRVRAVTAGELEAVDPALRTLRNINTRLEYEMIARRTASLRSHKEGRRPSTNNRAQDAYRSRRPSLDDSS